MNAYVQLALIEKAKRVFALDQSLMLSFPLLTPLAFTAAELAALSAPDSAAEYAAANDFARAMNFIPRDIVANTSERMLWEIYADVLSRAQVARDGSDATAEPTILYDLQPDGTQLESEALKTYRQYRDAWFVAREDYAAHKLTGEFATDPAVARQWTNIEEPRLRAALDAAAQDWEAFGHRSAIEAALAADRTSALSTPGKRWHEWQNAFNSDLDLTGDPSTGGGFAPTGLSPRDFADHGDWLSFELSSDEMKALVAEAPEALKRVLDDDGGGDIQKVTFEYRSVALVRPWFHPEALTSRIWTSGDPDLILSDGTEPPQGVCPAYATACIFVRKVEVATKSAGSSFRPLLFTIDPKAFNLKRELKVDSALLQRLRARSIGIVPAPTPVVPVVRARGFSMLQQNAVSVLRRRSLLNRGVTDAAMLNSSTVGIRLPDEVFGTPSPPPPSPPLPPQEPEISVLAFICKRLPKTPDPAPELSWS